MTASERTVQLLAEIVKPIPKGTNLALLQLMWAMVSGAFLQSRGAVHSAMVAAGFGAEATRRSWQALRRGVWSIDELIERWREIVWRETDWQVQVHQGWQPVALDITAFWRPKLKGWPCRWFHSLAQRLMPGVGIGKVVDVGRVGGQRVPLLRRLFRSRVSQAGKEQLEERLLAYAASELAENEIALFDAGFKLSKLTEAGVRHFLVRQANNCTFRRNELPQRASNIGRPPEYGEIVRPVARTYKDNSLAASQPDHRESFVVGERTVMAHGWDKLVRKDQKVAQSNTLLLTWAFFDPHYQKPLVVTTPIAQLSAEAAYRCFPDRWPVEQLPQTAKQMLGLGRQFVFAPTSCQRLPELALLVGNILTILAATLPPTPSGFWDRAPRKTPGRLRRTLQCQGFPYSFPLDERICQKSAHTDHLPKGIAAHRRQKGEHLPAT